MFRTSATKRLTVFNNPHSPITIAILDNRLLISLKVQRPAKYRFSTSIITTVIPYSKSYISPTILLSCFNQYFLNISSIPSLFIFFFSMNPIDLPILCVLGLTSHNSATKHPCFLKCSIAILCKYVANPILKKFG